MFGRYIYNRNAVYKQSCCDCQPWYISQKSQWLKRRRTQHKSDCAVVGNHPNQEYQFDYENVDTVIHENYYDSGLIIEMYSINKQ